MNYSYKKTKYFNYKNLNNLKNKTLDFCNKFKKFYNKNSYIVSIDECGFNYNINPIYNWSKKGTNTYIKNKIITTTKRNISICASISIDGKLNYKLSYIPYNSNIFLEFLKSLQLPKNTIILMDNVPFHHSKIVNDYIEDNQYILLFTPPYSPWFNPIENIFSCIKNNFRKNKNIINSFNIDSNKIINTINNTIFKILDNSYLNLV
jgi:transposase